MDKAVLSMRQREVLFFLRSFVLENDQLPPASVIRAQFGWASENAAFEHLIVLERKGFLERNAVGKFRFARDRSVSGEACRV